MLTIELNEPISPVSGLTPGNEQFGQSSSLLLLDQFGSPRSDRASLIHPQVAQRGEGKQADEKHLPAEERYTGEREKIRAFHPPVR